MLSRLLQAGYTIHTPVHGHEQSAVAWITTWESESETIWSFMRCMESNFITHYSHSQKKKNRAVNTAWRDEVQSRRHVTDSTWTGTYSCISRHKRQMVLTGEFVFEKTVLVSWRVPKSVIFIHLRASWVGRTKRHVVASSLLINSRRKCMDSSGEVDKRAFLD